MPGAADKDKIGTSGVMSQALEFSNEFSRCFLDSQVSGPPIYSAAARSGHAWRTGQGPVCSHDAVTLLVMSAAPWQPEARPEQHSPTLEPAHPSPPPRPVDFVLCIPTLHLAFGESFCETHAISWALPSSQTNLFLLFLCLRSGSASALTEWSLSCFLLHGSPPPPVCVKPSGHYFITFPRYSSAKVILSLTATAQASCRLDYGLKHMYVFLKNIQFSCLRVFY